MGKVLSDVFGGDGSCVWNPEVVVAGKNMRNIPSRETLRGQLIGMGHIPSLAGLMALPPAAKAGS